MNYVQSTNFATKDALPSGDPLKIVKGTEINTEFNNIATAVATKADTSFVQSLYPVGSVYINASDSTNPNTLFGFGTWAAFGAGRVLVGLNSSNALFDTAEETGGSYDATLPSHTHTGTTGNENADHVHSGSTSGVGDHNHTLTLDNTTGAGGTPGPKWSALTSATQTSTATTAGAGAHSHSFTTGGMSANHQHAFTTGSSGSSATNANIQPYITVYMWKRTA
jgi:hypothetical protein